MHLKRNRFAADFVMGFKRLEDAHKVQRVLPKRCARFDLEINAEKTQWVRFGRPPRDGGGRPETFDFLGFTHYWANRVTATVWCKRKPPSRGSARRWQQSRNGGGNTVT